MLNKIKKFYKYIAHYQSNKQLLRIMNDQDTFPLYLDHYRLSRKYTNCRTDSAEQILSNLVIMYHSIEKGLAMTDFRLGFGQPKICAIVSLCNKYLDNYNDYPSRLINTVAVLKEYDNLHKRNGFLLKEETQHALDSLFERTTWNVHSSQTRAITRDAYFSCTEMPFKQFAESRHSVRDFSGQVVDETRLKEALSLAQTAPSACNRQSTRVYAVYDEDKRHKLVDLQNHARGFADFANPLLVITTELRDWGFGEQWFGGYLDAGIYIMNLLYSLHYYKIAAIPLNWYADQTANTEIHDLMNIPESQVVVAFIACGEANENFKLVTSKRRDAEEIVTII